MDKNSKPLREQYQEEIEELKNEKRALWEDIKQNENSIKTAFEQIINSKENAMVAINKEIDQKISEYNAINIKVESNQASKYLIVQQELLKKQLDGLYTRIEIENEFIRSQQDFIQFTKKSIQIQEDMIKDLNKKIDLNQQLKNNINQASDSGKESSTNDSNSIVQSDKSKQSSKQELKGKSGTNIQDKSVLTESILSSQFSRMTCCEFDQMTSRYQSDVACFTKCILKESNAKWNYELCKSQNENGELINEDVNIAMEHIKLQLDQFLRSRNSNIDYLDINIHDIHTLDQTILRLPTIGAGKTDFVIADSISFADFCKSYIFINFEIKTTKMLNDPSDYYIDRQSIAQLLSANIHSHYPVLQITTDLTTFKVFVLTKLNSRADFGQRASQIVKWTLNGNEAIPLIAYWIESICNEISTNRIVEFEENFEVFQNLKIAKKNVKDLAEDLENVKLPDQQMNKISLCEIFGQKNI